MANQIVRHLATEAILHRQTRQTYYVLTVVIFDLRHFARPISLRRLRFTAFALGPSKNPTTGDELWNQYASFDR
ncbi:hypothetical protein TSPI_07094 [Trichinella spiralis]|uniref:Uncharacterized protein n=1 Tax=Trichinella spiralis TaxID=6334 RepID=A0ABR3KCQ8_TRISP